ncbi:hypothetical protein SAMN04487982_103581 [Streptomyces sp. ok210]|nr:hypothetical protein SAMN04487982_103581 [Streptomyces sp. ok210]
MKSDLDGLLSAALPAQAAHVATTPAGTGFEPGGTGRTAVSGSGRDPVDPASGNARENQRCSTGTRRRSPQRFGSPTGGKQGVPARSRRRRAARCATSTR